MIPFRIYASVAAAGLLVLTAGAAPTNAQTTAPQGPSASPSSPANPSPDHRRLPGPSTPRPGSPSARPNESLGQAPGGVIQPPATRDDGSVIVPRNQPNTPMPTIRPPGTPGGNPNVHPQ